MADQEAVLSDGRALSAKQILALGSLSLNNFELSWSGSLTTHDTDVKVFSNGNAVIGHEYDESTGSVRVLDETSRYTPLMEEGEMIDVGFIARGDGSFVGRESSRNGGVDIFAHNFVLRHHECHYAEDSIVRVRTLGSAAIGAYIKGGVSVGPMLDTVDFEQHPINFDASLGAKPPFQEKPLSRPVLYETENGEVHMRLFDARPGSPTFSGATPSQVVEIIKSENEVVWGCFLDGGQTAKLVIQNNGDIMSYGNRHYLRWPANQGDKYVWVPEIGRPTASAIVL